MCFCGSLSEKVMHCAHHVAVCATTTAVVSLGVTSVTHSVYFEGQGWIFWSLWAKCFVFLCLTGGLNANVGNLLLPCAFKAASTQFSLTSLCSSHESGVESKLCPGVIWEIIWCWTISALHSIILSQRQITASRHPFTGANIVSYLEWFCNCTALNPMLRLYIVLLVKRSMYLTMKH